MKLAQFRCLGLLAVFLPSSLAQIIQFTSKSNSDGSKFLLTTSRSIDFSDSQIFCELEGGNLARVDTAADFALVSQLVAESGLTEGSLWIGLTDEDDADDSGTDRFGFVDGVEANNLFFARVGLPPWATNQPDNNNVDFNEDCVQWVVSLNLWNDVPCDDQPVGFICRVEDDSLSTLQLLVLGGAGVVFIAFMVVLYMIVSIDSNIGLYKDELMRRKLADMPKDEFPNGPQPQSLSPSQFNDREADVDLFPEAIGDSPLPSLHDEFPASEIGAMEEGAVLRQLDDANVNEFLEMEIPSKEPAEPTVVIKDTTDDNDETGSKGSVEI